MAGKLIRTCQISAPGALLLHPVSSLDVLWMCLSSVLLFLLTVIPEQLVCPSLPGAGAAAELGVGA